MELSKQEMELFHPFQIIGSKNFFYKSILNWSKDSKKDFRNRKWNCLNRKRNNFFPFPIIGSKNFINKSFLNWYKDSNIDFRNKKRNYLNRKRNYFTPFQSSDQKTSLTEVSPIGLRILKWISETGNGII